MSVVGAMLKAYSLKGHPMTNLDFSKFAHLYVCAYCDRVFDSMPDWCGSCREYKGILTFEQFTENFSDYIDNLELEPYL